MMARDFRQVALIYITKSQTLGSLLGVTSLPFDLGSIVLSMLPDTILALPPSFVSTVVPAYHNI